MRSLILSTATKYLLPILLLFSFFVLIRGHYEPGGGFVGGLVAASAFALYTISQGVLNAKKLLPVRPIFMFILGLALSVFSAIIPVLTGEVFFKGLWLNFKVPVIGALGTPLLFDVGVFFVVIGVTLTIIFNLAEE